MGLGTLDGELGRAIRRAHRNRALAALCGFAAVLAMAWACRQDIAGALGWTLTLRSPRVAPLTRVDELETSRVTVVADEDFGSPFHMVRSDYAGTPQPWNESVSSHYRVLRVAGRLLLVHVDGPAPDGGAALEPGGPAPRFTGWLMNLPPDVDRFLAGMVAKGRVQYLTRPFVPLVLDTTVSALPVWLGLAAALGALFALGRVVWRSLRVIRRPLTDPALRVLASFGDPLDVARAADVDVSAPEALRFNDGTVAGLAWFLRPGRFGHELWLAEHVAKLRVREEPDEGTLRVELTMRNEERLAAVGARDVALAAAARARKFWKCRVLVDAGVSREAATFEPAPLDPIVLAAPPVIDLASATCPYCGVALLPRPLVICPKCNAPHHDDCWKENRGRCTTFGCAPAAEN